MACASKVTGRAAASTAGSDLAARDVGGTKVGVGRAGTRIVSDCQDRMQPGGTYPLNDSWESLFPPEGSEWLDPGALEVVVSKAPARETRYIEAQWQVEQFQQPGLASKW